MIGQKIGEIFYYLILISVCRLGILPIDESETQPTFWQLVSLIVS